MSIFTSLGFFDGADHCIDIVEGDLESLEDMGTSLRLSELIASAPYDHLSTMLDECHEHLPEIEQSRLHTTIREGDHIVRVARLEWCEFVELIDDLLREGISLEIEDHSYPFTTRLIADIRHSDDDLFDDESCDLFDEIFFVQLVWYLTDHDHIATSLALLDPYSTSHHHRSSTSCIGFDEIFFVIDDTTCREIWPLDELHQFFDRHSLW